MSYAFAKAYKIKTINQSINQSPNSYWDKNEQFNAFKNENL